MTTMDQYLYLSVNIIIMFTNMFTMSIIMLIWYQLSCNECKLGPPVPFVCFVQVGKGQHLWTTPNLHLWWSLLIDSVHYQLPQTAVSANSHQDKHPPPFYLHYTWLARGLFQVVMAWENDF